MSRTVAIMSLGAVALGSLGTGVTLDSWWLLAAGVVGALGAATLHTEV